MIFAIYNRIDFTDLDRRYTPFLSSKLEALCYYESIPDDILDSLEVGDVILVGNYDGWLSWLIMYLTDSTFSHLMLYDVDGFVGHMTLSGYRYQKINEFFGPRMRFLPARLSGTVATPDQRKSMSKSLRDDLHIRMDTRVLFYWACHIFCVSIAFGFHRRQFGDLCYCLFLVAFFSMFFSASSIFGRLGWAILPRSWFTK